jgi:hypothetical protein
MITRVAVIAVLVPTIVILTLMSYMYALHSHPRANQRPQIVNEAAAPKPQTSSSSGDALMDRLLYWRQWPNVSAQFVRTLDETAATGLGGSRAKRFFVWQTWQGGFNNERMSLELAYFTCLLTRRVLVMPPAYPLYLLDASRLEDYFDATALREGGVEVISFNEFLEQHLRLAPGERPAEQFIHHGHAIWTTLSQHPRVTYLPEYSPAGDDKGQFCWVYPTLPPATDDAELARIRRWCLANARLRSIVDDDKLMRSEIVFVPTRKLFDHYYSHYYFRDAAVGRQALAAVRQAVHLVEPAFRHAADVLRRLPPAFNAIHVRRNDFQYDDIRHVPVATVINNTRAALPPTEPLYIATDEKDPAFLSEWRALYTPERVHSLAANMSDVLAAAPKHWYGIIEMIVASQARLFIGSRLSTFSGYITRLRGYTNQTYQETHFTTDQSEAWLALEREQGLEGFRAGDQLPLWTNGWSWATWGREFKEGWDPRLQLWDPKTV